MTFRRLLDDPTDDFENALLRSARLDLPSDADVRRGILSIAAVGAAGVATSAAASGLGGSQPLAAVLSGHQALGAAAFAKWVGIGLVAGLVTTGGGTLLVQELSVRRGDTASARAAGLDGTHVTARAVVTRAPVDLREISAPEAPEALQPVTHAPPTAPPGARVAAQDARPARRRAVEPVPAMPASGLPPTVVASAVPGASAVGDVGHPPTMMAEIAALSRARLALSARATADVFRALGEYETLPRSHVLDSEAFMVGLEAWLQAGQASAARASARAYLAAHPDSPHRSRLQQIAGIE